MSDFRSDRMPSPEGRGLAKSRRQRAWEAYQVTAGRVAGPAVEPVAKWIAGRLTEDLVGFWLVWQLEGGFEGMQRLGMSRSALYRRIAMFRKVFGQHPDEFQFPGVTIDLDVYLSAVATPIGDRATHPAGRPVPLFTDREQADTPRSPVLQD